jgi:voltage-gated potassium channel
VNRRARIDRHWWRAVAFTATLALLVGFAARPRDPSFAALLLATAAAGFGFFYILFPGGLQFAIALANGLAVYATLFAFFSESNFARVHTPVAYLGFLLPVLAFLASAWRHRRRLAGLVASERLRETTHFPRLLAWLVPILLIGAATFAVPEIAPGPLAEEVILVAAMAAVSLVVAAASRDVVAFLLDASLLFEAFFARIRRLLIPTFAFLTLYSLLVIVFACIYRLVDEVTPGPLLSFAGQPREMSFAEALYFSVVTLSTIGYGDIVPFAPAARAIASIQAILGVLLLLFGFAEIMSASRGRDDH